MQPEHQRYWRGWRLYLERGIPWDKVREMSLDDVDLENLLLDRVAAARAEDRARREALRGAGL